MTAETLEMPGVRVSGALGLEAVHDAARRLLGSIVRTPVLESQTLNQMLGARVLIKAESLQSGGSFKFRGALNALLAQPERPREVVAYSSGNHAIGVAMACRLLEIPVTVVMPADAPSIKLAKVREAGGNVVFYRRDRDDRNAIAEQVRAACGGLLIPSFDDAQVIAGQGTVALELIETAQQQGLHLEQLFVPCGGGGLVAGSCIASVQAGPGCSVVAVEPQGFDRVGRAWRAEAPDRNASTCGSICDALLTAMPSRLLLGLPQFKRLQTSCVDDAGVARAVAFAHQELGLMLEPSGAIALAAVLKGNAKVRGKTIGVICSGANIDPHVHQRCIDGY
ncbi:threonine ammonia-lyase [Pseudomonas sessilinigenes]|uniref:Threonine/serine dehydratase n=1 Tax=Pseudomonas sessilinigenes TaxID=658629 RepID=A0ABX8MVZ4_9PSED|nr:threonine/serine dehydratase [Pseudomonas sessilinigenes]QXH43409.1 threonine/serine dehydratase [Pseudomonas sessilinigenes]